MLTRIKLALDTDAALNPNNGSLFQGALMERIDSNYADFLHISQLKPYSQYVSCSKGEYTWIVQTLTETAKFEIIDETNLKNLTSVYLKYLDENISVVNTECETVTREELLKQTYFAECPRYIKILFATPTAFKVSGSYLFYPALEQIFRSLIQKYDAFSQNTEIYDESLIYDLAENVTVAGYNIRSTRFSLEGVKIPSFTGTLNLKISGPQQLVNLVHLLLKYGTYSGVGVKTAIGMGALKILERKG